LCGIINFQDIKPDQINLIKAAMMNRFITFSLLLLSITSCTKYELQSVDDNIPPLDQTISEEQKISYINRLYITLLGVKPTEQELQDGLDQLNSNPHDVENRKALVAQVMQNSAYYPKIWQDARGHLLDGVDTVTIANEYDQAVLNYNNSTGNVQQYWYDQMMRLQPLLTISNELATGQIDRQTMHRSATNSPIYDEINMGTENFVVSVFQNFFFRYPTNAELEQGKNMVDGQQAVVFLQAGQSKSDFLDIVFNSSSYSEGQVIYAYQKYLFRNPSSEELSAHTQAIQSQGDYTWLQTEILAGDEYLFF
jgi:hypothetical protein